MPKRMRSRSMASLLHAGPMVQMILARRAEAIADWEVPEASPCVLGLWFKISSGQGIDQHNNCICRVGGNRHQTAICVRAAELGSARQPTAVASTQVGRALQVADRAPATRETLP